jgi:hypothetical protein
MGGRAGVYRLAATLLLFLLASINIIKRGKPILQIMYSERI